MNHSAPGGLLSRQDLNILESAEVLLRLYHFDYDTLSELCGEGRGLVRERFPYPELLAVGIVAAGREAKWTKDGAGCSPELLVAAVRDRLVCLITVCTTHRGVPDPGPGTVPPQRKRGVSV